MTLEEVIAGNYSGFIDVQELICAITKQYQCSSGRASLVLAETLAYALGGDEAPNLYRRGDLWPCLTNLGDLVTLRVGLVESSNMENFDASSSGDYQEYLFQRDEINGILRDAGFPMEHSQSVDEPKVAGSRTSQPSEYEAELETQLAEMERELGEANAEIARLTELVSLHSDGLMKIAIEVRRKYWLEYNPESELERPKQDVIIAEIMEQYGLSKAKAQAVEAVACPISR